MKKEKRHLSFRGGHAGRQNPTYPLPQRDAFIHQVRDIPFFTGPPRFILPFIHHGVEPGNMGLAANTFPPDRELLTKEIRAQL